MTQTKNNIAGPFSQEDWTELVNLRSAIKMMKSFNDENYFEPIERYSKIYEDIWNKYFPAANDNNKTKAAA